MHDPAPPQLSALTAIAPVDGRYGERLAPLRPIVSEAALIAYRVRVEVRWLMHLAAEPSFAELPALSPEGTAFLEQLLARFGVAEAEAVKRIEATTNHDVKAVEYYLRKRLGACDALAHAGELVHVCCTSEDINNLAYALMLQDARDRLLAPRLRQIERRLAAAAGRYASLAMLSRTHGQAATPTTLGKEMANFRQRLAGAADGFDEIAALGKMNGAVGNYNAHLAAWPELDWPAIARRFVESLGLRFNPYTTQIEPHDWIAAYCHALVRANTVLLDLARDLWSYVAIGYFRQRATPTETGSSTMPHKVNPIDFENAEGNLGVANALLEHFAAKLPVSRWQRDLSDSTVLRNLGVALAHSLLALDSLCRGLDKLEADAGAIAADLDEAWEVLAEPVQTVMRRYGLAGGYEQLKALTRGQRIDRDRLHAFIGGLELPAPVRERLLALTPADYVGNAAAAGPVGRRPGAAGPGRRRPGQRGLSPPVSGRDALRLQFPGTLGVDDFLAGYWQRRPLLLPGAFPGYTSPLDGGDLAGLACEAEVESRLVIDHGEGRWELRHGPFTESDFAALPDRAWTLLVQDVDKHVDGLAALVDAFDFLPSWRFDDLMFSYAAPGGSVGPHTDAYDVFLLQGAGRRRWQIAADGGQPRHVDGLALRVLQHFEPEHEWMLAPGDALYLPPGVAHHGVAVDECITVSVGLRTPSLAEMLVARATHLAQTLGEDEHYGDAGLTAAEAADGLVSTRALARATRQLRRFGRATAADTARWFGELVTEAKPWLSAQAPEAAVDAAAFAARLRDGAVLERRAAARFARSAVPEPGLLFVDGQAHPLCEASAGLAPVLCRRRILDGAVLAGWLDTAAALALLHRLYAEGKLYFRHE